MKTEERNRLILEYLSYVEKMADNFCNINKVNDINEFFSQAIKTLIISIENYNNIYDAKLKTWIITNVRWALKKQLADMHQKESLEVNIDSYNNSLELSVNGTEQSVCDKDYADKILAYIDSKPKKRIDSRTDIAEIVSMYHIDGFTMAEIAEKKGIGANWIGQIIKMAIEGVQDVQNVQNKF